MRRSLSGGCWHDGAGLGAAGAGGAVRRAGGTERAESRKKRQVRRVRRVLRRVDWSLLLTFAAFFVFIGNMGRVPAFRSLLEQAISGHELVTAVCASQVISNVPAALLLSGFTSEWDALIVGTNLGGLGTLIASMASLISYKFFVREHPQKRGAYVLFFTGANLLFLAVLLPAALLLG